MIRVEVFAEDRTHALVQVGWLLAPYTVAQWADAPPRSVRYALLGHGIDVEPSMLEHDVLDVIEVEVRKVRGAAFHAFVVPRSGSPVVRLAEFEASLDTELVLDSIAPLVGVWEAVLTGGARLP